MSRRILAVVVVLLVLCGGLVAWSSDLDAEVIARGVRDAGMLGSIGLIALLVFQCVVAPVPSEPIMMAAGYVYGPGPALVLSWTGVVVGAGVCFWLARAYGRPLAERVVKAERLDAAEAGLRHRGLWTAFAALVAIRAVAFHGFDVVSYACGIVRLPFAVFLGATALGVLPKVFAFTYAGATFAARPAWLDAIIIAGTFGVLGLALLAAVLRRRRSA
ncbi:MAG: TVP38/TMEM64 family protein [Candidatus Binatia bacterium]